MLGTDAKKTAEESAQKEIDIDKLNASIDALTTALAEQLHQNEEMKAKINELEKSVKSFTGLEERIYQRIYDNGGQELDDLHKRCISLKDTISDINAENIKKFFAIEYVILGFVTAVFLFIFIGTELYFIGKPSEDYAKRIMWNLQYGNVSEDAWIRFFDKESEAERKYKNQYNYEMSKLQNKE